MIQATVVETPTSALAYAVVIRAGQDIIRQKPAHDLDEARRIVARLLAQAEFDVDSDRRAS